MATVNCNSAHVVSKSNNSYAVSDSIPGCRTARLRMARSRFVESTRPGAEASLKMSRNTSLSIGKTVVTLKPKTAMGMLSVTCLWTRTSFQKVTIRLVNGRMSVIHSRRVSLYCESSIHAAWDGTAPKRVEKLRVSALRSGPVQAGPSLNSPKTQLEMEQISEWEGHCLQWVRRPLSAFCLGADDCRAVQKQLGPRSWLPPAFLPHKSDVLLPLPLLYV